MNQLLPVVTWTDHPNRGHVTPEKVTNQTCKSLGHDRKFTRNLELDDMTILLSCFPKKVVGHHLRRNNGWVAFSKDFRLSDYAFQGVYIFSPMGFPTVFEELHVLWDQHALHALQPPPSVAYDFLVQNACEPLRSSKTWKTAGMSRK